MSGASIRFEFNLDPLEDAIKSLITASSDLTPLMDEIGDAMVAQTKQRFQEGVDPEGNPWPPSIRALEQSGKTLIDSGRLSTEINHEASPFSVIWGSNLKYAETHQFGATITAKNGKSLAFRIGDQTVFKKSVTIPKRAFLGLNKEDEDVIAEITTDYIQRMAPEIVE